MANNIIANNDKMFKKSRVWDYIPFKSDIVMRSNLLWPKELFDYSEGNYVADPKFVESYKGVFYLKKTSPAIKAGLDKYAVGVDFFGIPVVDNNKPDLGCFSYNPELVTEKVRKTWYEGWPFYFNPLAISTHNASHEV